MSYPKSLFRNKDGVLSHRVAESKEREANLRAEGWLTLEELYPDPEKSKVKA